MKVAADAEAEADGLVDADGTALGEGDASDGDGATEAVGAPVEASGDAIGVELQAATSVADAIAASQFLRSMSDPPPRPRLKRSYARKVLPAVVPQLVGNDGATALRRAIADAGRFACEPKVDGLARSVPRLPRAARGWQGPSPGSRALPYRWTDPGPTVLAGRSC